MAQPYTVKQLDYFKSMLVILETAMVKAKPGVSEKSADPLPESSFVPLPADVYEQFAAANNASAATENVATDVNQAAPIAPEAAVSSSAFFETLPWLAGDDAAPVAAPVAVLDVAVDVVAAPVAVVASEAVVAPAVIASVANTQTCSAFFQALPWETGKALPAQKIDLVAAMASNDITAIANLATQSAIQSAQRGVQQNPSTASAFFQSLPW